MANKLDSIQSAAIYLRKSRVNDGMNEEESLETHKQILLRIANKYNWSYSLFEEIGSSASMDSRKELLKMLDAIQDGDFDAVLVMDQDRLSRDRYDSVIIKKTLSENDTYIVTANEECIDLNDRKDSLVTDIKSMAASWEYEQIAERMEHGKQASALKGNWVAGTVPLGYEYDRRTKKLILEDREVGIVKEIFRAYMELGSFEKVAIHVNRLGYKTRKGLSFVAESISTIIRNPTYKGVVYLRKYKMVGKKKKKRILRDPSEWIKHENIYPVIIDGETWDKANEMAKKRKTMPPRARQQKYALTKLVHCGYCGKVQGIQLHKRQKGDYKIIKYCWRKNHLGELCTNRGLHYDPVLEEVISEIRKRRDFLAEEISKVSSDTVEFFKRKEEKLLRLKSDLARIEKQLEKINYMYINDMLTDEELACEKPSRVSEKERILNQIKELEEETQEDNVSELKVGLIRLDEILKNYDKMSDKRLNDLLSNVINRIVLYNYKDKDMEPRIDIEFK
ncbi:recombinase family protein [Bacillus cereus]|nr:recombinase family protein [Bacillus cereus]